MGAMNVNPAELERAMERSAAAPIAKAMGKLRRAAWRRLVVERGAGFLAGLVSVVIAAVLVDYLFRLPMGLRVAVWAAGVTAGGAAFVRLLLPVWRFRPGLVEVALRVEQSEGAKKAGLRGRLASAMELAARPPEDASPEMVEASVREALARFATVRGAGPAVLAVTPARRGLASLSMALLPVLAAAWLTPEHARVGLLRVLTPWTGTAWPKRTAVASVTKATAHPLDSPLTLRAKLTRSARGVGRSDVSVVYRVVVDGKPGPDTRLLLNPVKPAAGAEAADVYESALSRDALRLAAGLTPEGSTGGADASSRVLEFSFRSGDDQTAVERVILVERPRVASAGARVIPPAYVAGSPVVTSGDREVALDSARRGTLGPVLAGSRVELTLRLNKPVPTPGVEGSPKPAERAMPSREEWQASVFGPGGVPAGAAFDLKADAWTVVWTAESAATVSVRPVDAFEIAAAEDASVAVSASPDTPPGATVVEPARDESVLATAVLPVVGEGRDDVGLKSVSVEAQRLAPPAGSAGAAPEAVGDARTLARLEDPPFPAAAEGAAPARPTARASAELNLGEMGLSPGDEVWVTATATDGYSLGGATHEAVRSAPRKLRIISEAQLSEQILDELAALKTVAQRIDQDQAAIAERTRASFSPGEERGKAKGAAQDQRAIAERLRPAKELLDRASGRAERNGLSDQGLKSLLSDAADLVQKAAQSSDRAAEAAERVARTPAGEPAPPDAAEQAQKDQGKVRESMEKLSDLLSRGRDGWAARQAVDRLLNEQRDLIQQTKRAGEETAGKSPQELTNAERAELDRLARAQEDLSRKARQAVEDLAERANRVKPTDPAQAQAMEKAAQQAMRNQLSEQMQKAAEQQRQNQTGQAQQNQEQAAETMQQMLEQLDQAQQRRDEALKRMLANLKASIDGLIRQQESEHAALLKAAPQEFEALAAAMVRLHGNTLGLAESTEAKEAREVAARLEAAASQQDSAAANLKDPPDVATADENERMSLVRLKEARELAEVLEQEAAKRDASKKLRELRAEYGKLLETQQKLREDTAPLVGKELSRRDRNTAKTLGTRQAEVRAALAELRDKTEGLSETTMLEYAHRRLDAAAGEAATLLGEGEAPAKVGRRQAEVVEVIRTLMGSLKESQPSQDEFRQQQGGGGQQGQQGGQDQGQKKGLVPPFVELMVLKQMQEEAARRTKEISRAPEADEVEAIGRLQRELSELGQKVADAVNQQGGGPGGKPPAKPQDKPGEGPGGAP